MLREAIPMALRTNRAPFDTRPCGPCAQGEAEVVDGIEECASS